MKIRKLTSESYARVSALLRLTFPDSNYEVQLVEELHKNRKAMHEWICIHRNNTVAYIAFTNAFVRAKVCGMHLSIFAVKPEYQNQGIGSELLRFAMRQDAIRESAIFVSGDPAFFQKFGFEHCIMPVCPFDKTNARFLCIRNNTTLQYTVGYEPEFKTVTTLLHPSE